jgi:hypothetical protein
LSSAIRRPLSLPDLKRGDFADPTAEVEDVNHSPDDEEDEGFFTPVEEQLCWKIPLPQPGPNEEHELANPSSMNETDDDQQNIKSADWYDKEDHSGQYSAVVASGIAGSNDSQTSLNAVTTLANSDDGLSPANQYIERNHPFQHGEENEYDPYAVRPSLPVATPTRSETFFLDEDSPTNLKSCADAVPPTPVERNASSHSKRHSSGSSGHSLSGHKIGQVQLIQSSASIRSIPSERTANARVFTPPSTPDKSRRSSSFSKIQRPIHTSGSASSQASILKTFIPWPHDGAKYTKVQEPDSESRSSHHSERLTNLDDKERSFEELISSGGTIHCTITPDPIRNMEVPLAIY